MSSLLSAELAATCNALGYFDEKTNKYYADGNTLETVKDLIRYLRRDDESHDIRRQLGETKVLQTDLLPLMKSYWEETNLFDVLLRLIVNLTTPALSLWNEELPTEKTTRNHYLQVEGHLQGYKEAFADEGIWSVLSMRLGKILEINYAERGDENSLIIERILILIRNIMYVPTDPMAERRTDNDANIHDQVLWALHQSGMLDVILYITSSTNEQAYYMHIVEILSFMLREQKPSELASAALQRSQTEKLRDEAELLAIRNRENNQKRQKVKAYAGTRHSRFGGTYLVQSMKSISDKELIYHKPLNKLNSLNFDSDKKKPKTPKNRLPMMETSNERRSAFSIRLFLKEFCVEFLNGAYNTFMYHVKDNLTRARAQAHDESYYLWAMRFFMEFNRCYKFEVKLVSETMAVQTFHFVQQQSENFYDLMSTDKKKIRLWSKRLHLALLAYKELFMTLNAMEKSSDSSVKSSANVIKSNIFYVLEYREFILTLLVNYDELKMSNLYLKDLIETQHVFLKMLEIFCGKEGTVMVQKKGKAKKQKSKPANKSQDSSATPDFDSEWDQVSSQISSILDGAIDINTDIAPFDAASDIAIDNQKTDAMKNIQKKLRSGDLENAIGLLRAAREVWPENDSFGSNNMAPEEEFLAIRDIFLADLGDNAVEEAPEEFEDEYDEEEEEIHHAESDFKLMDFIKRLAHPKVIRACGLGLRNFDTNSVNANHCIIKLLHRIAFDCKMYVMLFQVSLFKTFQKIFTMKEVPEFKELVKFAIYIVRQFFKVAPNNNKVYMEALFWKSTKTAYEIEEGYGSYQEKSSAALRAWSEEEENELRTLFMEHQKEHQDEDVVDWICNNLIDNTKSRRMVLKKLKEMYLLVDYKSGGRKSAVRSKIPQNWGAEEETQLRELFEQLKDAVDPLTCIMDRITVKRPKNRIVEKLLVMGLIQDKTEMRKKRPPKMAGAKAKSRGHQDDDGSDNSVNSGSSSDEEEIAGSQVQNKTKTKRKPSAKALKVSPTQLSKQLIDVVENDMSEALEWLKESFTDAIEDIEDGSNEGIPIVPIMDYAVTAMDNAQFQQLLKYFGVVEPFDEQEIYWRIPADITMETLRSHADLIQQAIDKCLVIPDYTPEESGPDAQIEEENDDDLFERIRKTVRENKLKEAIKNSARKKKTVEKITQRKIMQMEHSDQSDNDYLEREQDEVEEAHSSTQKNRIEDSDEDVPEASKVTREKSRRGRIIDSDSEEELDKENVNTINISEELKRSRSSGSLGSETPQAKRSRIIDSDDD